MWALVFIYFLLLFWFSKKIIFYSAIINKYHANELYWTYDTFSYIIYKNEEQNI